MKIEDQTPDIAEDENSLERDSDTNIVNDLPASPVDKIKDGYKAFNNEESTGGFERAD
jgi:hypothetical protein